MIALLFILGCIFLTGLACMIGVAYPFMAFSEIASAVFRRVERASFYPRNLWASLASAASYLLFAAFLVFVYAGIGYLAGLIDRRPWTTGLGRFLVNSNDNLWWLAFDGLVISATVALIVFLIVFALVMIWEMLIAIMEFVAWLFRG